MRRSNEGRQNRRRSPPGVQARNDRCAGPHLRRLKWIGDEPADDLVDVCSSIIHADRLSLPDRGDRVRSKAAGRHHDRWHSTARDDTQLMSTSFNQTPSGYSAHRIHVRDEVLTAQSAGCEPALA